MRERENESGAVRRRIERERGERIGMTIDKSINVTIITDDDGFKIERASDDHTWINRGSSERERERETNGCIVNCS